MKRHVLFFLLLCGSVHAQEPGSPVQTLIPWLLKEETSLRGIPFSEVIQTTSGKRVIAVNVDDRWAIERISRAMDQVLQAMNDPASPTRKVRRINEVSSYFEDLMEAKLNTQPDFLCEFPRTAEGREQRSGYPDLRLVDKATNRVYYLDPKLYAKGSRESSFRTFYFEPKRRTNKVNDDARHLIVGIEHDRNTSGAWRFLRWELVDLSGFRVKLKAEFEGSNRDMYRREAIVASGPAQ